MAKFPLSFSGASHLSLTKMIALGNQSRREDDTRSSSVVWEPIFDLFRVTCNDRRPRTRVSSSIAAARSPRSTRSAGERASVQPAARAACTLTSLACVARWKSPLLPPLLRERKRTKNTRAKITLARCSARQMCAGRDEGERRAASGAVAVATAATAAAAAAAAVAVAAAVILVCSQVVGVFARKSCASQCNGHDDGGVDDGNRNNDRRSLCLFARLLVLCQRQFSSSQLLGSCRRLFIRTRSFASRSGASRRSGQRPRPHSRSRSQPADDKPPFLAGARALCVDRRFFCAHSRRVRAQTL